MPKRYWHFLRKDRRLGYDDGRIVRKGSVFAIDEEPLLCERGFHASRRAIDALRYAPGPIICRVELGGAIVESPDKVVAQRRKVIWWADATNTLHEFACRCAVVALKTAGVDDQRAWAAIEVKRRWLAGEATDDELAAAAAAASAVWDARAAARAAAWAAAAAADAAWYAGWYAGWAVRAADAAAAAADAAAAAQNKVLESLLQKLSPGR